jgi:hypothetical protein
LFVPGSLGSGSSIFNASSCTFNSSDISLRYLLASYGQLGRLEEPREPIRLLLKQSPEFTVSGFGARVDFRLESDKQHFLDGLIKAGPLE